MPTTRLLEDKSASPLLLEGRRILEDTAAMKREVSNDEILARGNAVMDSEAEAILSAKAHLGAAFVQSVRELLACRGRVCVTGIGKARLIGDKISATLASTGTLSYPLHPVEALHGDLGMVHGDDVVIGLSKSGGSELVKLLPLLREKGCRVILLTADPESAAAEHANHVLHIGDTPEACPLGYAPSSSTASMLAVGDALALTLMELRAFSPEQYAGSHPGGALGRALMQCHEIMRTGEDCPQIDATSSVAECYEAILKAPRRAGACAVVDPGCKLVGIVTQGDFFRLFENRAEAGSMSLREVMSADPKRVSQDELVQHALDRMRQHRIDELPVVDDDDRLVGMIDVQDLIARGFSLFDAR
jgi:arabinose-5-phosphate isomerase